MELERVYIDRSVANLPETRAVRSRISAPVEMVDGPAAVYAAINEAADPVGQGKRNLLLTANHGPFIRPCPGTRSYRCCGYRILNIARFCTLDCSYCILQAYFHPPVLQYYVNQAEMFAELTELFRHSGRISRIGTGEFTDSSIWEACTDLNARLVSAFSEQNRAVLEIKTKTTNIESLRQTPHNRKTIAAWSLNTPTVVAGEERGAPPVSERLRAAAACESWGYPLAFHFDPMVLYEGCEAEYRAVVEQLLTTVSPDNIVWISLGSFRFMPQLKPILQQRFADSTIVYGEFISGLDGKMRYFKPLRIRLYRAVIERIREIAPRVTVYFCMEDDEVWEKSLGYAPAEKGGLPRLLDQSAAAHCGLDQGLLL